MVRFTTTEYGVLDRVTSLCCTQVVDMLGRWARRTWSHPGWVAMTGKMDG